MISGVLLGQTLAQAAILATDIAMSKKTKAEKLAREIELSQIEKINSASLDDDIFNERPKSRIIKWLMNESSVSTSLLAEYLGCSTQTLRNKLSKDSFSLDDIIIAAYACGYSLSLVGKNIQDEEQNYLVIDPASYFEHTDNGETLKRMTDLEKRNTKELQEEYDRLKAELESMKRRYSFLN